ncbi:MAG: hypothetical protein PHU14_16830, partial [Methylovulum sp.]|nr:hypothetical protein [Methylovulum sp.]
MPTSYPLKPETLADTPSENQIRPPEQSWSNLLLLRPYGHDHLSPKVKFWLGCSLVVIVFMASLEGLVWGLIGSHLVPDASAGVRLLVGLPLAAFVFCLIWISDASLLMFDAKSPPPIAKPEAKKTFWGGLSGKGTFFLGIFFRIGIIGISLYVTAPLLNQVIRDDDITRIIETEQRAVKGNYLAAKEEAFAKDIVLLQKQADDAATATGHVLEAQQNVIELQKEYNAQKAGLLADITRLKTEMATHKAEMAKQKKGGNGYKGGKGPKYFAAETSYKEAQKALETTKTTLNNLVLPTSTTIAQPQNQPQPQTNYAEQINTARETFNALKAKVDAMDLKTFVEAYKAELPEAFPKNTPGYRIKVLKTLDESEKVPHWQSTEGIAQALLGVLFLSLLSLKSFEPKEVRLYFSEDLQDAWRRYQQGRLDKAPIFRDFTEERKGYKDFALVYRQYEQNAEQYLRFELEQTREDFEFKREADRRKSELAFEASRQELDEKRLRVEQSLAEQQVKINLLNKDVEAATIKREHERAESHN